MEFYTNLVTETENKLQKGDLVRSNILGKRLVVSFVSIDRSKFIARDRANKYYKGYTKDVELVESRSVA